MADKLNPQSKAVLAEVPGVAFVIKTEDQRMVILTPATAVELARKILSSSALIITDPTPARGGLVQ